MKTELLICTHDYFEILVKVFATGGKLLRSRVFKIPKLIFHSAVKFLGILLPLHMELDANGSVDAHREIIIDDIVRYAILIRFFLVLLIQHFYLPAIHHY